MLYSEILLQKEDMKFKSQFARIDFFYFLGNSVRLVKFHHLGGELDLEDILEKILLVHMKEL